MLDQTDEPDFYRYTLASRWPRRPARRPSTAAPVRTSRSASWAARRGESPLDTFDRLIGEPMKIERYGWPLDPAGNPYGGGGVQFLPRDFMKLGQLMLDGGTWHGRRILSRDFVARASAPLYHLRNITYGYLWWGIDYPYKDRTVRAFFAGGAGGQIVMVGSRARPRRSPRSPATTAAEGMVTCSRPRAPVHPAGGARAGRRHERAVQARDFKTPYGRPPNQ